MAPQPVCGGPQTIADAMLQAAGDGPNLVAAGALPGPL
jgi:hypothetical protein